MPDTTIHLHPSWLVHLQAEFQQPYMQALKKFLQQEKRQGKVIYPAGKDIFNAFNSTPYDSVKVVVLGQDPYHGVGNGQGQAHGLSFSVPLGIKVPPSLGNIYAELKRDLDIPPPSHGYLHSWAEQGVLLLNATLTVEQGQAASHQGKGWEIFTDKVIHLLNHHPQPLVFLLWGSYAQKKGQMIDKNRHCVLQSPHPSPLSAYRGFLGNGHFSKTNHFLQAHKKTPINWASVVFN